MTSTYEPSEEMLRLANGNDEGMVNINDASNMDGANANAHADGLDEHHVAAGGEELEGDVVVRTMEVPKWLSNMDVTRHLVGSGKKKLLEDEFECTLSITGHGSGTKDPNLPGYNLPHLLITLQGTDIRQIGRIRRALEDSLIDYIIEHSPAPSSNNSMPPPPALGRLLYSLALSSANASPKTKDHTPNRTVLARAHYPMHYHTRSRQAAENSRHAEHAHYAPPSKKVWMNVKELPRDENTQEYHGRFLAGKNGSLLEYYRTKFQCRVDIYGVWGDSEGEEDEGMMCKPYVLVTSEEGKSNVDKCLQFIEHRIREHEEKYGVSRQHSR